MYYIYKIENTINQKKYIGLTNNIIRRRTRHFSDLKRNCHDNSFLQKEYNIYGKQAFSFEIVFEGNVTVEEIDELEKYYISFYDSYRNGYNQNEGGNFGSTNGGSHLTQTDIFNILAVLEFMTNRPGQLLAEIYEVSRTTINRIKKGVSHTQYKEEYDKMPLETRKALYDIFCESNNLLERKANIGKILSKRKLTEQQVHLIFLNEELGRPKTINYLMKKMSIASSNTIYCILKQLSYQDYYLSYQKLSEIQKQQLATLL